MKFTELDIAGVYLITLEPYRDERGFFARAWCRHEFEEHGLAPHVAQVNVSYNKHAGTLRGMHYQMPPYGETKLVRCTRGAIYDVVIDMRPDSPSFRSWVGAELTADNRQMLYVPENFAHGFITLTDNTEITYQVSQFYTPEAERGVRYDDPAFGIEWPVPIRVVSEKDKNWPDINGHSPGSTMN